MLSYTLKTIDIKKETEDTYTYFFKQPALKKIKYLPGQYLTVVFRINGRRYLRPYSFSSCPEIDNTLNITVKRMAGGVVSNHMIDRVNVGDLIEVLEPLGEFTIDANIDLGEKHLIFWGSGSGITPLISIIKYQLHKNIVPRITLVYGNRSKETTIFYDQIEELKGQYPERFFVYNFYTKAVFDVSSHYLVQGRIDPERILSMLLQIGQIDKTLHYICGPVGLKDSIKTALQKAGIDSNNVYSEDFEVVRNPEDFKEIQTQNVTLINNGQETVVEVTKGKSILEAGLDAMLEMAYSCQTGDCLLCKGNLTSGTVKMIGGKKMSLLQQNEYLLCCSFPVSDNVIINIE